MRWLFVTNIILFTTAIAGGIFNYQIYNLYEDAQRQFKESTQQLSGMSYLLDKELSGAKNNISNLEKRLNVQQKLSAEQKRLIEIQSQFSDSQKGKISGLESELGGAKTEIDKLKQTGGEPLPKDFINSLLQATARVRCLISQNSRSETIKAGSGSVLGRYEAVGGAHVVMTNAHVVAPKAGTSEYDCDIVFGENIRYDAEVVTRVWGGNVDFAFLKLGEPKKEPATIISYSELGVGFCEFKDVAPGDLVTVLSYPGFTGPERAVSEGKITDILDGPIYEASALIDLGSSGGVAVSNKKRCVLGMPTWKGVGDKLGLGYIQSWPMMLSYK